MRMRYSASSIPSLKNRTVFFDANSLIYIFWSTSPDAQEATDYGSIMATLIKNEAKLVVNEIVISEIINRVLRLEFYKSDMPKDKFKEYRDSPEGKSVQADINEIIKNRILNRFQISNDSFSKEELNSILTVTTLDFNDKLIELLCKKKNMILLTHDYDFSESDVDILSANNKFKSKKNIRIV